MATLDEISRQIPRGIDPQSAMQFRVTHHTEYHYRQPASDSFVELRVWPQDSPGQRVLNRNISVKPEVTLDHYIDYFGNRVEYFSIPFRHEHLSVKAWADVETVPWKPPDPCMDVTVGEARQIIRGQMIQFFDFIQPTHHVPFEASVSEIAKHMFPAGESMGACLESLNQWIYRTFRYKPGSTNIATPLREVIARKQGVCQDFAHLMLGILRIHGFPARYVSGYIESDNPAKPARPRLTGAAASHAWVEVCLPGGWWWGLDPTNNQAAGERHVRVAAGRDYSDVSPLRGTFKGARDHKLRVMVSVERRAPRKAAHAVKSRD